MKLANHLGVRLTGLFIIIFLIWSVIYFLMQMHEIHEGIDEGLTNLKQEFIVEANQDIHFVENMEQYNPINMIIKEVAAEEAKNIKEEHSTTSIYFETEKEFEEVRILTSAFRCEANDKYYRIQFFTSTVETDDLIENMLILLIVLWLTLGILLLLASKYIIKKSSKPFNELLEKLHYFSLGQTQMIDFPKTNITEFKSMNKAVEALLKENIQAYNEQKTFIENASHELQTPLAVTANNIELLMNTKGISEDLLKELGVILAHISRMKRLSNSLLLLSKIRNKQFSTNVEVDMKKVVSEVYENFEAIIDHKQIAIQINEDEHCIVNMNVDLAYTMISNLVKNAVNYNIPNGRIIITLNKNSFIIANDGKPLPDGINIFERYSSKSTTGTSTGLGLAIVSSIVSTYNFRIQYTYDGMHRITILFN